MATRRRVAIVGNQAFALVNFRSALIRDLLDNGHEVLAMAPDFDKQLCPLSRTSVPSLSPTPFHARVSTPRGTWPMQSSSPACSVMRNRILSCATP